MNRVDPDGRLVQLVGSDEERKKALELIKLNLREADRKHVSMNKNGVVSVDANAKGGLGLMMLRDLARPDKATVTVQFGRTATDKGGAIDLQVEGGGTTVSRTASLSGDIEVHVDPRGGLAKAVPPSLVVGHELFGHGWDWMFRGKSSERSAINTESNLLLQLGLPQYRPVDLRPFADFEW